jgi:hypothetical protein
MSRYVAFLLVALCWFAPIAEAQTVLFFAGAETGDLSEVNTVSAGMTANGGTTPFGAYAYRGTNQNSHARTTTGFGVTTIYVRFNWRIETTITNNWAVVTPANAAASHFIEIMRVNASGKLCWTLDNLTCIATGTTTVNGNTWYLIEAKFVISPTVGGVELKVNGNTEFTSLGTNTSAVGTWDFVQFGPDCGNTGTVDTSTDNFMVCSGAYCPPGKTLARQATAGTPTYNAWTKTSCTVSTIDGCWSNTPFSATSNASSTVANDVQTMVVSDFATTQSGHGTEIFGNASTINACKAVMIAKSGTASAPLSIRRRLAGVDTDTAKVLTTSDAPYDDGIWTTTPAVLRNSAAMEIGAVHGVGSATDTVEDMWLICDALDATALGVLWFSGVESGTIPAGTGGGVSEFTQFDSSTNHAVTSSVVKTGNYALSLQEATINGGFAISKKGLGVTTGYTRTWWRAGALPTATQSVFRWLNAAQSTLLGISVNPSGRFLFSNNGTTVVTGSTTTVAPNTWYLIETAAVVSATVGGMELKVNGTVEFTSFGSNTSSMGTLDQVQWGPSLNGGGGTPFYYFDDMMICSGAYCPLGGTIARQGAAGTPTYTAWTKNSCTSSLIENCWSQTPFNTTPNASNATAAAVQTMFIATFSATQSGHGTETIGASDTINACKVFMVAKSGTASAPLSIRRRLSGVDTDTAITLTTTDAAYDDGIWTTTATVLRGATMEAGALHGSGSATDTVEDVWMMCDRLTSVATAPRHRVTFD